MAQRSDGAVGFRRELKDGRCTLSESGWCKLRRGEHKKRSVTVRAVEKLVNRFVLPRESRAYPIKPGENQEGLTSVFHVTDDAVINRFSFVVEGAVVMPVDVAVSIEVFANNCPSNVRSAVDCKVGGWGVK